MPPKFQLNQGHIVLLQKECMNTKKITLPMLKSIAKYYYETINPKKKDEYEEIMKMGKDEMREKLVEELCMNVDKLSKWIEKDGDEVIKPVSKDKLKRETLLLLEKDFMLGEKNLSIPMLKSLTKYLYDKLYKDDDIKQIEFNKILKLKDEADMRRQLTYILFQDRNKLNELFAKDNNTIVDELQDIKAISKDEITNSLILAVKGDFYANTVNAVPTDVLKSIAKYYYEIGNSTKREKIVKAINNKTEKKLRYDLLVIIYPQIEYDFKDKEPKKVKKEPELIIPVSSEKLGSPQMELKIKEVDDKYLKKLKDKINKLEVNEYNIKKFEEDIKNDDFIKRAVEANIKALEYKQKIYEKLSKVNWEGVKQEKNPMNPGKGMSVNLNEIIADMIKTVDTNLKEFKSKTLAENIEIKRKDLLNILYNKDNGIYTLQGTSRENIRISLIKIMYMFFKIPEFFFKGFNNFMLTGSAGSGKTKLASVIAFMMNNLGILVTDKLVVATKQNLVGEYIGQSAPKTRNLLANTLEGVVFIDEAYTLTPCSKEKKDSFSEEAVGELINFIDKFIGCMVLIVAGYKKEMNNCFLTYNEGIGRRFPKVIDLIPYSSKDMYKIFETFLNESIEVNKIFTKKQREFMKSIISALNDKEIFNNQAGDMLNLSKVIGEDAILFGDRYDDDIIKYSFMKFCATKNIAIDF